MKKQLTLAALFCSLLSIAHADGPASPTQTPGVDLLTFHGSPARLGWNDRETALSPAHVNTAEFGKIWETPMDGQVYGAPLYVSGLTVGGLTRDVVYAATENNSVYALDAATGVTIWTAKTLVRPLSEAEYNDCNNIHPLHGITSTPVIDRDAGTIYVCSVTQTGLAQRYDVWGLDIATGAVKPGWPVTLKGDYKGCKFDAGQLTQRGALNLVNDWIYIPFSSRCDIGEWHGWVMGVNAKKPGERQRAFCPAPTVAGGGIWGSAGVASDSAGLLYAVVGNGKYDLPQGGSNVCESIVRLMPDGKDLKFSRDKRDYYVPTNFQELDDADQDLGGSSAIVLPDLPGVSTPHLLVTCGKDGVIYLVNRDALGGLGGELHKQRMFGANEASYHANCKTTPAYFDAGAEGRFVYVAGNETGPAKEAGLVALKLGASAGGQATFSTAWTLPQELNAPGTPTVSSDGHGGGIVWLIESNKDDGDLGPPGVLHAFDAVSGKALYRSDENAARDVLTDARKFTCPTVAAGRVFVGTHGIVAYGLLSQKGAISQ